MNRNEFCKRFSVSRETSDRLDAYVALLQKWSRAINLIGPTESDELWSRHIADCGQLVELVPKETRTWLDLGSGAGLPGLVVAILMTGAEGEIDFGLIEADKRKAAFLREAARQTDTNVTVIPERAETLPPRPCDVVSARAFAPLRRLLRHVSIFAPGAKTLLLHKGRNLDAEIDDANEEWRMDLETISSLTDPAGAILKISSFSCRQ